MRTLMIFALTAAVGLAQPTNRAFHFVNLQTGSQFAEAATVIRSIGEIRELTVDAAARTMTLQGAPQQVALAAWLFGKLDRTAGTMTQPDAAELDYRPSADGPDDTVRVFYFKSPTHVDDFQRMATVIRSLTEIRRGFLSNAAGAFVVRGTRQQLDAAKWLVESLDQPSLDFGANQYRVSDDLIRLFSVPKLGTELQLSNFAAEMRAATQMQRIFSYYPLRVIALRGTPPQVENAATLINRP